MKRMLALMLAVILALSVTACGGSANVAPSQPSTDVQDTPPISDSPTVEPSAVQPEPEPEIYTFGDSITSPSGLFVFTPSFDGFADAVANFPDENYMRPNGQGVDEDNNPYVADEGKVMMYYSAKLEYVGDSKENETFDFTFKVDFDDGYVFDGGHNGVRYSKDEQEWGTSSSVVFEPLNSDTTRYTRFCIEVPNALETDFEKQTLTVFTIEGEDFTFIVDTKAAAEAKAEREAAEEAERIEKMTEVDKDLSDEIKKTLQGTWSWSIYGYAGTSMYTTSHDLTFDGDTVSIKTHNTLLNTTLSNKGTYYVANAYIVLNFEDGAQACMPYTFENGELSMSQDFEGAFYIA